MIQEGAKVFHLARGCCTSHTQVDCKEDQSCIGTKKLDLKSNCTPYIVPKVSHY